MAVAWGPLQPASVHVTAEQAPAASAPGAVDPTLASAVRWAQQVFLDGNGLPGRWAARPRFVILETGFGLGHNFLATWAAWRDDPRRCDRLWYLAIDGHPPRQGDLRRAHAGMPLATLADTLIARWPPLTPDLHAIDFDGGRVRLLLALGDIAAVLPELLAPVDAFYLDGFASPHSTQLQGQQRLRQLHRLAAPGATVAAGRVADGVCQGLAAAGFEVTRLPGPAGQPDRTVGRFAPRVQHPGAIGRRPLVTAAGAQPRIAVVGAGLAGMAVAQVLAARGLAVTVFDRHATVAGGASGNDGGLCHGIVHGNDGPHARWLRAAALHTQRTLGPLLATGQVPGALTGLLRGEQGLDGAAMQALIDRMALPADYVQVARSGLGAGPAGAAWHYPGGGWVSPAALCAHWAAAPGVELRLGQAVQRLQAEGARWQLLGDGGHCLQTADAVLLCHADDVRPLLAGLPLGAPWPLQRRRGQVTLLPAGLPGAPALPLPLADGGYALRLPDGRLLCGATSQPDDDAPALRDADQAHNLAALQRLTGWAPPPSLALAGRVGWRLHTDDRLPLLGAMPAAANPAQRPRADQPRHVPRHAGLFVFTALGSRGISQAALGAEVLASWLLGDPVPLPAALLDAVDVARFDSRAVRRADREAAAAG